MKPRSSSQTNRALTLMEVLVVIAVLAVLAAIFLPARNYGEKDSSARIICINNLKEIGLAYRVWEGDHGDKYPMLVSMTNGGALELAGVGNVAACFQVMSNVLSNPKILICPADTSRNPAANFSSDLKGKISYFVNIDATETYPQMMLSGDDNFAIGGVPVKSGLLEVSTNTPISWTAARHTFAGNILMADSSVQQVTQSSLRQVIQISSVATNRLAVP
jgi:prepilin-type N-terminal cleavage/methylation domain-containing protein